MGKYNKEDALKDLKILKTQANKDREIETSHMEADDVLLALIGDDEIYEAFHEIEKWYC